MKNNTKKKSFVPVYLTDFIDEHGDRVREYIGPDGEPRRLYGLTAEECEFEKEQRRQARLIKEALEYLNTPCSSPVQPHGGSGVGQSAPEGMLSFPKAPEPLSSYEEGFGEAQSRVTDRETCREAAKNVNVSHRCKETLLTNYKLGGDTITEELTDYLNHKHGRSEIPSNLTPRVSQLCKKGFLEARIDPTTGKDAKRRSRQGSLCTIWYITPRGIEKAKEIENEKKCA